MDTARMVHVLGQVQHLLAVIERESPGVRWQLARDANVEGIQLGSLAAQVARCKFRIEDIPSEAYASAYFANSSHLPAVGPAALAAAAREVGVATQDTVWGLFLDYRGFRESADGPASEITIALDRLGRWATEVGARWVVLTHEGPVVENLPLHRPQRPMHH